MNEYFSGNGVTRYFLPDLPSWANRSESAKCLREGTQRFLNMDLVRGSLLLNYEESIQLQLLFNIEANKRRTEARVEHFSFQEEEKIFFEMTEKIQAGIRKFSLPKYKRVHLVWLDPVLTGLQKKRSLKRLMKSARMSKGHPVFVSLCLSQSQLVQFVSKSKFALSDIRVISRELFSPYSLTRKMMPYESLYFKSLFRPGQKLHFFSFQKKLPIEFKGDFINHKF